MADRTGIMLCYPFDMKRFRKWGSLALIQPKLDGERCRAKIFADGEVQLLSSSAEPILSMPHIAKALSQLGKLAGPVELDGELYVHCSNFPAIHSAVSRKKELHPDYEQVQFHIFDVINEKAQLDRLKLLDSLIHLTELPSCIQKVPTSVVESYEEIEAYADELLANHYEGFVLRHPAAPYLPRRSTMMMKYKEKKSDYYMIVGCLEAVAENGTPKGELGALICSSDGQEFRVACGPGITQEIKRDLWRDRHKLPGSMAHVYYQNLTPGKGIPRHGRFYAIEFVDWSEL